MIQKKRKANCTEKEERGGLPDESNLSQAVEFSGGRLEEAT